MTLLVALSDAAAGWGTIAYNGHTFSGLRNIQVSSEPVWDEFNRVIVKTVFTLEIRAYHTAADVAALGVAMAAMRAKLEANGGVLTMTGLGIGDMVVGVSTIDLDWGPRPAGLVLEPTGVTAMVQWRVTWCIREGAQSALPGRFS